MVDFMSDRIDFDQFCRGMSPRIFRMNLKSQLKFHLSLRSMTQSELARKAGVSKQVLSLWMGGAKPKNIDQIKRVADVFGVSVDNLLFGTGVDKERQQLTELDALLGDGWISGIFEVRFRRIQR